MKIFTALILPMLKPELATVGLFLALGYWNEWYQSSLFLSSRDWDKIDAMYGEYDKIKIEYPYGQFVTEIDNIQAQIQNINEIHERYMKQIAYGKYSGTAEDIIAEYQAALQAAGIDDVTAELQSQFDALYQ